MSIYGQAYEALDNATANDYPHEYDRPETEYVLEIHDWSGILEFDLESVQNLGEGIRAVKQWREDNPQ